MASTELAHTAVGAPPPEAQDVGLRCPACDYNLTGVPEDRCPECGETFDRSQLEADLADRPAPIPGWDDQPDQFKLIAFLAMCEMTWFRPTQFARQFPARPRPESVRSMAVWSRLVAVTVVTIVVNSGLAVFQRDLFGDGELLLLQFAVWVGVIFGSVACEALVAFTLEQATRCKLPYRAKSGASSRPPSWLGLVVFHSTFLPLTTTMSGLACLFSVIDGPVFRFLRLLFWLASLVCLIWWWYTLVRCVFERTFPDPGRKTALAVILLVGPVSMVVGAVVSLIVLLPLSVLTG